MLILWRDIDARDDTTDSSTMEMTIPFRRSSTCSTGMCSILSKDRRHDNGKAFI